MSAGTETVLQWFVGECRGRRIRPLSQFAEEEIIVPNGPFEGMPFRLDTQPFVRRFYEELDSGKYRRFALVGPSQSGKSLIGYVILLVWMLFELRESVALGVPHMDLVKDKWRKDILPVINRTRYRELLPVKGAGSRGGLSNVSEITMANGSSVYFLSGQGDDKRRSGITVDNALITESDGLDEGSSSSKEAEPIEQIFARTYSRGDRAMLGEECTALTSKSRSWVAYERGTQSGILLCCPTCSEYVRPEREHLVGWQDADNVIEAKEQTRMACPSCGALWDDKDRRKANQNNRLYSLNEQPTDTFSFRYSATNNLFQTLGMLGAEEWRARQSEDSDNAEKKMRQFFWALPWDPPVQEVVTLRRDALMERVGSTGEFEPAREGLYHLMTVDVGRYKLDWVIMGRMSEGRSIIAAYGEVEIRETSTYAEALWYALETLAELAKKGIGGKAINLVGVDVGYPESTDTVKKWCSKYKASAFAIKGVGVSEWEKRKFAEPTGGTHQGNDVVARSPHAYGVYDGAFGCLVVHLNADYYKTKVHDALSVPIDARGSLFFFRSNEKFRHRELARQLTAERQETEIVRNKGAVRKWVKKHPDNHKLDCSAYALALADLYGVDSPYKE